MYFHDAKLYQIFENRKENQEILFRLSSLLIVFSSTNSANFNFRQNDIFIFFDFYEDSSKDVEERSDDPLNNCSPKANL